MSHLVYIEEPLCKNEQTSLVHERTNASIQEIAVSALAESSCCGLLMLIDKIIADGVKNDSTAHLVKSLIARVHKQTIAIAPAADDNPESFVSSLLDMAAKTTVQKAEKVNPLYHSAKLFIDSLKLFGLKKLNQTKLEQHWKDFASIFLHEKLKEMYRKGKGLQPAIAGAAPRD